MARLGDICNIKGGYAFKSENFSNQGVPVIRIGNITENGLEMDNDICFDEAFWCENEKYRVNKNDILVAMSGATVGKSCTNNYSNKLLLNQRVASISIKNEITRQYIYYFISSPVFMNYVLNQSVGCAQPNISIKQLSEIEISIPPLDQQQKIAEILDKVCELISYRKQQLDKLDLLVKARFVELFGEPLANNKGFPTKEGKLLFAFSSGKFLCEEKRKKEGVPVYGGNGINWHTDEPLIDYPTIVIGRVGVYCGNVKIVKEPIWVTDNAIYIKEFKTNNFNLDYLYMLMTYLNFSQYADFSGQPKITQKPLEKTQYIIPPLNLQNQFAEFVEQTDKSKLAVQNSIDKLEILKKSLMQKYFG